MTNLQSFTRRELYNLVWKTPVEKLAKEFGMSGRGLAKLCERHAIPVPPRGYWARKEAGQKVKRTPLVEVSDTAASEPKINLRLRRQSEQIGSVRGKHGPDPYSELYNRLLDEIGPISVRKQLRKPHPLISEWLKREESEARIARNSAYGRGFHEPRYKSPLARRRLRILDALFREFELRGCAVSRTDEWKETLEVRLGQDTIEFTLSERIRQVRRRLTEEERAQRYKSDQKWTQTRERTNELILEVSRSLPTSVARSWQDREEQPLENQIREITAGLLTGIAYVQSGREQQENERRKRIADEEERRRREAELQAELDRKTGLRQRAMGWAMAKELRNYVSAVSSSMDGDEELKNWSKWALKHADEIDPIANGSALETSLLFEKQTVSRYPGHDFRHDAASGDPDWLWGHRWWLKN